MMRATANFFTCVGYALKTLLRVLPALGRSTDHQDPPPGLGVRHFVVGGVIAAIVVVGSIIGTVKLVLSAVAPW